ncbi:glycoside hydrolase family 2 TIM barrel-domain containing protein [Microbacterium sp. P01]|uniref:glycoside hydrolase family 2 TIM barrel-domain containing protein n=1 Tax=Microbacterium sp. P01 TaxID=3366261 RepID=UPI00366BDCBC
MTTTLFTDGWTFRKAPAAVPAPVRLPHDAMIAETRSPDAATGNHGGFFPGGRYVYAKEWLVPDDAGHRTHSLLFEGVYGITSVTLDGLEVGTSDSGYREFAVTLGDIVPGDRVTIEVHVDNTDVPNSRWYTGSGIYRPVWLESVGATRIARDGVHVVTRSIAPSGAAVDVTVHIDGEVPAGAAAAVTISRDGVVVAHEQTSVPAGGKITFPVTIRNTQLWSADHPDLYDVRVDLSVDGDPVDERRIRTGLRTVQVDARHGLRVNGETVLLRGACVHHDNGILGAATFAASERRRARLLKETGYNAVRSAHNPLSRSFLDACDELGLYVMDELTDVWLKHKTSHDGADRFAQTWRADAAALIAKDRNRASVIMYSIGNEIAETATDTGVTAARNIDAFFSQEDPARPTTLAVNLLLNMMASRGSSPFESENYAGDAGGEKKKSKKRPKKDATSTAANLVTAKLGRIMELASRLPAADKASRDSFAVVDVAGYNYAFGRYKADRKRYPERVIVGSESMPGDLPAIWKRVTSVPGVIGDFMWTGWDYLGEAGIGAWSYGDDPGSINKPYPALVAGPGAFDITGLPGVPALLAQAVWGTSNTPGIAVRPMDRQGQRANRSPWRTSDAVSSWSWRGFTGAADIEVYSAADEVELLLNGRSIGRKKAGSRVDFLTRFRTTYEPGELVAVGYVRGVESGRSSLRSSLTPSLTLRPETTTMAGPDDLAYVWIELADEAGVVDISAADEVTVSIAGPATLAGLGNAATSTEESFADDQHTTSGGRALAIIRGGIASGDVTVTVRSAHHGTATLRLKSEPEDPVHTPTPVDPSRQTEPADLEETIS